MNKTTSSLVNTFRRDARIFLGCAIVLMALAGVFNSQFFLLGGMTAFAAFFVSNVAALRLDNQA